MFLFLNFFVISIKFLEFQKTLWNFRNFSAISEIISGISKKFLEFQKNFWNFKNLSAISEILSGISKKFLQSQKYV